MYFEGENAKGEAYKEAKSEFRREIIHFGGTRQLIPRWEKPIGRDLRKGILPDLRCRVIMSVKVLDKSNQLIAMACAWNRNNVHVVEPG